MKRDANRRHFEQHYNEGTNRGCSGKRIFLTFRDADRSAKWTRRMRDSSVHAYHCVHCNKFHVGGNS